MQLLKKILVYFFFVTSTSSVITQCTVRIILTTALTSNYFEFRKEQYLKSFNILNDFGFKDFYIVEALSKHGPTFLEQYCNNVFYSQRNNPSLRNKGINEAKTILEALHNFNFDDEDMIIKMTGRYHWLSNGFFMLVQNNQDADAIVKYDSVGQVHTLAYAMRCKHLKEMLRTMPYTFMESHMINLEHEVAQYINKKKLQGNFKVVATDQLNIEANLLGSSACPGANGVIIF